MIKLEHKWVKKCFDEHIFDNITCYDELISTIKKFGSRASGNENDTYQDRIGAAYEVYAEFFFKFFSGNTDIGVRDITHTSYNKYEFGKDFTYKDFGGKNGFIQVKFRSNPREKFASQDLGSFGIEAVSYFWKQKATRDRIIFFTNLVHTETISIFTRDVHNSLDECIRTIGRNHQETHIKRYNTQCGTHQFWIDFANAVNSSLTSTYKKHPVLYEHQQRMLNGILSIM